MNVVTFFYQQALADNIWLFNTLLNQKKTNATPPYKKKERKLLCVFLK